MNLSETLAGLLQATDQQLGQNKTKGIHEMLRAILEIVHVDPLIFWKNQKYSDLLAKQLLLCLVYDISDDEDVLISAAHLSYFYAMRAHELNTDPDKLFDINKNLVILVGHYSDYLYQTVAMCYRGKDQQILSESEFTEGLQLGRERIHLLELKFLHEIDELFDDYKNDEFLLEREIEVVQYFEFSEDNFEEAELLSKVLYAYISKKIQHKDFDF